MFTNRILTHQDKKTDPTALKGLNSLIKLLIKPLFLTKIVILTLLKNPCLISNSNEERNLQKLRNMVSIPMS